MWRHCNRQEGNYRKRQLQLSKIGWSAVKLQVGWISCWYGNKAQEATTVRSNSVLFFCLIAFEISPYFTGTLHICMCVWVQFSLVFLTTLYQLHVLHSVEWQNDDHFGRMWKKSAVFCLRYYESTCLEIPRKATNGLNRDWARVCAFGLDSRGSWTQTHKLWQITYMEFSCSITFTHLHLITDSIKSPSNG